MPASTSTIPTPRQARSLVGNGVRSGVSDIERRRDALAAANINASILREADKGRHLTAEHAASLIDLISAQVAR